MEQRRVVSRDEWLQARTALLAKEKSFTHLRDQLSQEQRALPWVKVEKEYVFDAPSGKVTLAQLFNGRSQLFIKHFMMGPGQTAQCVGCSLEVDHVEGILEHLENHDVAYVAVARAPIEEIETVRRRMGWRFNWVSSYHSDFNYDSTCHSHPHRSRKEARSTISPGPIRGWKIFPATAFSSRTMRARYSTPIPSMAGAEKRFSGFTSSSI
jgi:predicted dithiol-disulfide oxidoreductase (DUF899 family)